MNPHADRIDFSPLFRTETAAESNFSFIEPPFVFNAAAVSRYPAEVSGRQLLRALCNRIGWPSLSDKRLLDFGCGVRFARTIVNLGLDIGFYAGVDTNPEPISWFKSNLHDDRFRFEHLNIKNAMYNPYGADLDADALENLGLSGFDAACMFSVITHQSPQEAEKTFAMLYRCVSDDGALYFTAFVEKETGYVERDPMNRGHMSAYNPTLLVELLGRSGWTVTDVFPGTIFQQPAFVCRKRPTTD